MLINCLIVALISLSFSPIFSSISINNLQNCILNFICHNTKKLIFMSHNIKFLSHTNLNGSHVNGNDGDSNNDTNDNDSNNDDGNEW